MKRTVFSGTIVLAVVSLATYGCGSPSNNAGQTPSTADTNDQQGAHTESNHSDHGGHGDDHGGHDDHIDHGAHGQTAMDKMNVELAKLSPDDAASAKKQHICPVSGEMLGTMGAPEKMDVNGQRVWICCDGCKDKLMANPDEYLAKLQTE